MWQRKQTLFMSLALIFSGLTYLFFPEIDVALNIPFHQQALYVVILLGFSVLCSIWAISRYKNRQLQFVINRLHILAQFVLLGVFVYVSLKVPGEAIVSKKGIGMLFPVFSIVFLVWANKAIKKDEALVKSVDRLR